jgi:hypothetical protein
MKKRAKVFVSLCFCVSQAAAMNTAGPEYQSPRLLSKGTALATPIAGEDISPKSVASLKELSGKPPRHPKPPTCNPDLIMGGIIVFNNRNVPWRKLVQKFFPNWKEFAKQEGVLLKSSKSSSNFLQLIEENKDSASDDDDINMPAPDPENSSYETEDSDSVPEF